MASRMDRRDANSCIERWPGAQLGTIGSSTDRAPNTPEPIRPLGQQRPARLERQASPMRKRVFEHLHQRRHHERVNASSRSANGRFPNTRAVTVKANPLSPGIAVVVETEKIVPQPGAHTRTGIGTLACTGCGVEPVDGSEPPSTTVAM
jgi:hypothetical protein